MYGLLSLILLFTPVLLCAQEREEQIATIRKQYADVESRLDSCTIVTEADWVDEEDYEGGIPVIEGFYSKSEENFIKITETLVGDWRERTTSYYLKDRSVFFVFIKGYEAHEMFTAEELGTTEERLWESGGEAKTLLLYETRVYVSGNVAIQILRKELVVDASLNDFDLSKVENVTKSEDTFSIKFMRKHLGKMVVVLDARRLKSDR